MSFIKLQKSSFLSENVIFILNDNIMPNKKNLTKHVHIQLIALKCKTILQTNAVQVSNSKW
jgi:hypothetical protein